MPYTIDFDSPELTRAVAKTELPEFNENMLFSPAVYSEPTTGVQYQELVEVGSSGRSVASGRQK